jgi:hypothetical protein
MRWKKINKFIYILYFVSAISAVAISNGKILFTAIDGKTYRNEMHFDLQLKKCGKEFFMQ